MDKKEKIKKLIIGSLITFAASLVVAGIIFWIVASMRGNSWKDELLVELIDSLGISGLLGVMLWCLVFLSTEGAFDMLAYSVKLAIYNIFRRNIRETALPKTYAEYKELKHGKDKDYRLYILIGSLPCLIGGLILLIPFNLGI